MFSYKASPASHFQADIAGFLQNLGVTFTILLVMSRVPGLVQATLLPGLILVTLWLLMVLGHQAIYPVLRTRLGGAIRLVFEGAMTVLAVTLLISRLWSSLSPASWWLALTFIATAGVYVILFSGLVCASERRHAWGLPLTASLMVFMLALAVGREVPVLIALGFIAATLLLRVALDRFMRDRAPRVFPGLVLPLTGAAVAYGLHLHGLFTLSHFTVLLALSVALVMLAWRMRDILTRAHRRAVAVLVCSLAALAVAVAVALLLAD